MKKIIFIALALIVSCANRGGISGGPEDKTPPTVIKSIPADRTTGFDKRGGVEIVFSEWLNDEISKRSVFVSPAEPPMKISVSGKKLTIMPRGDLLENTTYTITVGSGAQDLRGNGLASSFSLIFSTGTALDTGKIAGIIVDEDGQRAPQGTALFVYKVNSDTNIPTPINSKPLFVTECGVKGDFSLSGLSLGKYRVYGVRDNSKDRKFTPGKEQLYMPLRDVVLSNSSNVDTTLMLVETVIDTVTPRIVSAKALSARNVELKLSKTISDSMVDQSSYVMNSLQNPVDTMVVREFYQTGDKEIMLALKKSIKGKYRLRWYLQDSIVDTIDLSLTFDTIGTKATIKSAFATDSIHFVWKLPVDTIAVRKAFTLQNIVIKKVSDSLNDTIRTDVMNGTFYSVNSLKSFYKPAAKWEDGAVFTWAFAAGTAVDTGLKGVFAVKEDDMTGLLSGRVNGDGMAKWRVAALSRQGRRRSEMAVSAVDGKYKFDKLTEGAYRIMVYDDQDGNGKYSSGSLLPFRFPEVIKIADDSVYVRRRWEVENLDIRP
ncbi:MAG: Ig-like domain-containing protein [Fibrobacteres bacterium]|nr:Ig-like domain-containing protein [Fibrobacterota bacterium]